MSASRETLRNELDALEGALPALVRDHADPVDFWLAFAQQAVPIEEHAELDQAGFVGDCIDRMLARVGIDPDDPLPQPH